MAVGRDTQRRKGAAAQGDSADSKFVFDALDGLPLGLLAIDSGGTVRLVNEPLARMLSIKPDRFVGRPEEELFSDLRERGGQERALPGGLLSITLGERRLERECRALPGGGVIEVFTDRSLEDRLLARREQFLAIASHDLRNPLANIRSYSGMLVSERLPHIDPRVRRAAEVIARNADRALMLLQDFIDSRQAEIGPLSLERKPEPLLPLLQGSLAQRRAMANEKGAELSEEIPESLPVLQLDRERMLHALVAFLDNALSRVGAGGKVRVRCELRPGEVFIAFTDTGAALGPDEEREAFDRDSRVIRERRLGTGFALSVAKAAIEGHGGKVGVSSGPGEGATFFIVLPR